MPRTDRPPNPGLIAADAWVLAFAFFYAAFLFRLYGGLGETFDGFIGVGNALLFGGASIPGNYLKLAKAPLGPLAMAPFAAAAFARGGIEAALKACHFFQISAASVFLLLSWRFFLDLYGRPVAALLTVLLAFNPVVLRNAAFSNFDVSGAAVALLFLMTIGAFAESADRKSYFRMILAGAACFLVKYHQGMLAALPPIMAWGASGGRRHKGALLAAPAAIAAVSLGAVALCSALWMRASSPAPLRAALGLAYSANITGREASLVYFREMTYQLGPALALFAAAGFFLWISRRDPRSRLLAAALGIPILILSTLIKTSESRYTLFLLPLVYACVGAALDALSSGLKDSARSALAGLLLLAAPWQKSYASVVRLLEDPNFTSRMPYALGLYADGFSPEAGCVAWMRGEMRYPVPPSPSPMMDNWTSPLMADSFQFYTKASVETVDEPANEDYLDSGAFVGKISCRPRLLLIPRYRSSDPPQGGRWTDAGLGRAVDLGSKEPKRLRILADSLALP